MAFTSCASSGKYFSNAVNVNETQTQVVLSQANYKIVKNVSTQVLFTQKFKFDSKQLQESAYNALREEANLKGSQALINVTLEEINQTKYNQEFLTKQANDLYFTVEVEEEFIVQEDK